MEASTVSPGTSIAQSSRPPNPAPPLSPTSSGNDSTGSDSTISDGTISAPGSPTLSAKLQSDRNRNDSVQLAPIIRYTFRPRSRAFRESCKEILEDRCSNELNDVNSDFQLRAWLKTTIVPSTNCAIDTIDVIFALLSAFVEQGKASQHETLCPNVHMTAALILDVFPEATPDSAANYGENRMLKGLTWKALAMRDERAGVVTLVSVYMAWMIMKPITIREGDMVKIVPGRNRVRLLLRTWFKEGEDNITVSMESVWE